MNLRKIDLESTSEHELNNIAQEIEHNIETTKVQIENQRKEIQDLLSSTLNNNGKEILSQIQNKEHAINKQYDTLKQLNQQLIQIQNLKKLSELSEAELLIRKLESYNKEILIVNQKLQNDKNNELLASRLIKLLEEREKTRLLIAKFKNPVANSTQITNERIDITKKSIPFVTKPVSLFSAIGSDKIKIWTTISPIFMDIAKGIISPLDYFIKGCFAIRDLLTTPSSTGQRKVKLGTALLTACAAFSYVGIAITYASHQILGASVSQAALAAIPVAGPLLLVGIAAVGFVKEAYVYYQTKQAIKNDENKLKEKEAQLNNNNEMTVENRQREHITLQQEKNNLEKRKINVEYQKRRGLTSALSTIGYVISAFGLLFPPLLIVGASIVLLSAGADAVDKYQIRNKLATIEANAAKIRKIEMPIIPLSKMDSDTPKEKQEIKAQKTQKQEKTPQVSHSNEATIFSDLALGKSHAVVTSSTVGQVIDFATIDLAALQTIPKDTITSLPTPPQTTSGNNTVSTSEKDEDLQDEEKGDDEGSEQPPTNSSFKI